MRTSLVVVFLAVGLAVGAEEGSNATSWGCASSGENPYSGGKRPCCGGLSKCLKSWDGGSYYYKCYATYAWQAKSAKCSGSSPPPPPSSDPRRRSAPGGGTLAVKAFWWNVHWQCSNNGACKSAATSRFVELARSSGANIVGSIELADGSTPVYLPSHGLSGWTQINGPCRSGSNVDTAALAFAPGWHVSDHFGGCLRKDHDTRAFAVARVTPPSPVGGCSQLCVLTVHMPHTSVDNGHSEVQRVCGAAVSRCAMAMGDWNTAASGVPRLWSELIGGDRPTFIHPNQVSCCWPQYKNYGVFDHLASNIPGMTLRNAKVHPYQLTSMHPSEEHKPVSVSASLPAGDLTEAENTTTGELTQTEDVTSVVV